MRGWEESKFGIGYVKSVRGGMFRHHQKCTARIIEFVDAILDGLDFYNQGGFDYISFVLVWQEAKAPIWFGQRRLMKVVWSPTKQRRLPVSYYDCFEDVRWLSEEEMLVRMKEICVEVLRAIAEKYDVPREPLEEAIAKHPIG